VAGEILKNPQTTQQEKDAALSILHDKIGAGRPLGSVEWQSDLWSVMHPNQYPEGSKTYTQLLDWRKVELFEHQKAALSKEEVVSAGARAYLVDDKKIKLRAVKGNGIVDSRPVYPRTVAAAKAILAGPTTTAEAKELWADAHVMLFLLTKASDVHTAIHHLQKAISVRPKDWRLRQHLGALYMTIDNFNLALTQITVAVDVAPDAFTKWDVSSRKAKVLLLLSHTREGIDLMEDVLSKHDEFKAHPEMTEDVLGKLAVGQYMVCQHYAHDNQRGKAKKHFSEAESKRKSLSPDAAKEVNWDNRMLALMMVTDLDPSTASHGECHYCGTVSDRPKNCDRCKAATYCGRECQVAHWKLCHKKQCQQAKVDLNEEKKANRMHAKEEHEKRERIKKLPPLDRNLDPHKVWAQAVQLAKQEGHLQDAAFKFLVALFMDNSLDVNNTEPMLKAASACNAKDPVRRALELVVEPIDFHVLSREIIAMEMENGEDHFYQPCDAESLEQVNRRTFGIAMCKILMARRLSIRLVVRPPADAQNEVNKEALLHASTLICAAKDLLDPDRWLSLQFELGYSASDVGAVDEAKRWLSKFVTNLGELRQTNGGKLPKHWKTMKQRAELKLSRVPLMEVASMHGMFS